MTDMPDGFMNREQFILGGFTVARKGDGWLLTSTVDPKDWVMLASGYALAVWIAAGIDKVESDAFIANLRAKQELRHVQAQA